MSTLPPGITGQISITNVAPGAFASQAGRGALNAAATVLARIDGDAAHVFSLTSVESWALERDPEFPTAPPTWQVVRSVDGAGPIAVRSHGAVVVTVGFACPVNPTQDEFTATVTNAASNNPATALFAIPVHASVSAGSVKIVALKSARDRPGADRNAELPPDLILAA